MNRSTFSKPLSFPARLAILLGVVVTTVVLDQAMKAYAVKHWSGPPIVEHQYLGGIFKTTFAQNYGAFLSLLSNFTPEVQFWVLQVGNALCMLGIGAYVVGSRQLTFAWIAPLVLLLGGGLGNLIDRMRLGYVIDYLYLDFGGPLHTGVFNIADMAITLAFPLLLRLAIWGDKEEAAPQQPVVDNGKTAAA